MATPLTNAAEFTKTHMALLAGLAAIKAPAIDAAYPKADEFLDVRDYLKDVARIVDEHIYEVAKIAGANAVHHGIDVELGRDQLRGALEGNLYYDLEQEAIGARSAYAACHGPSAYDRARNDREADATSSLRAA